MVDQISRISTTTADEVLALITSQDVQAQLHTGDPGSAGLTNGSAGLNPIVLEPADWTSPAEFTALADHGGRFVANAAEETVGQATAVETASWVSLWHEADPIGAPGVFDTWRMNLQLVTPKTYEVDDPVTIQAGELVVFSAGAYLMAEE